MSRPSTIDAPVLVTLDASTGGFTFLSNCECGGGWVVEGRTLGREDMARVCETVSQIVFCPACGLRARINVSVQVMERRDKRRRP